METPHFSLASLNGITWSKTQMLLVDALNQHDCILYRSPRRHGTTFAICGLIATIMQTRPLTAHVYSIVLLGTTEHSCHLKAQEIKKMYGKDDIFCRGDTLMTRNVHATITCDPNYKSINESDIWIVDDADYQKYAIPILQMKKHGKCVFTYTERSEEMQKLETLPLFHCVCVSLE